MRSSNVFALVCLLAVSSFLTTGCSSTKTISENVEDGAQELKLEAGDTVKVITIYRQRYFLKITNIGPSALLGTALAWDKSSAKVDDLVTINYADLALIQQEYHSTAKTVGVVASVSVVGAMVAAVAITGVAAPVVMPIP